MKLTVDGEVFEFDAAKITNVEGMAVEKATGLLYNEWARAVDAGSMLARTALVWVVRKRLDPALKFDDVVFTTLDIAEDDADASDPGEPADESEPTG
jgi:hypothetical protein